MAVFDAPTAGFLEGGCALIIGLVDTLGRSFSVDILRLFMAPSPARTVGPAIASMLIYLLMALVLYFRPAGLFPAKGCG